MGHVDPLAQMIDRDLSPRVSRHPQVEGVGDPAARIKGEGNDGLHLSIIDDGEHHNSEHDRVARSANADRHDNSPQPCKHVWIPLRPTKGEGLEPFQLRPEFLNLSLGQPLRAYEFV